MGAIFVSYRRSDSQGEAGRLFDDLVQHFGDHTVFMDVAGIEAGRDFRKVIEESVAQCGVLLVVIGPAWLNARDESGTRRLDDPADFVRIETAAALRRDIPVIPVLVRGAEMPRPEQLPDVLKDLAYRNCSELTHARWRSDIQLLIDALCRLVGDTGKAGTRIGPNQPILQGKPTRLAREISKPPDRTTSFTSWGAALRLNLRWLYGGAIVLVAGLVLTLALLRGDRHAEVQPTEPAPSPTATQPNPQAAPSLSSGTAETSPGSSVDSGRNPSAAQDLFKNKPYAQAPIVGSDTATPVEGKGTGKPTLAAERRKAALQALGVDQTTTKKNAKKKKNGEAAESDRRSQSLDALQK